MAALRCFIVRFCVSLVICAALTAVPLDLLLAQDAKSDFDSVVEYNGDEGFDGYVKEVQDEYHIYVFGDTLADGLSAGLNRAVKNEPKFTVHQRTRAGTGLARPDRYNWNLALSKLLEGKSVDLAVVFIGANDTLGVTTKTGRYAIGSPQYKKAYVAYLDEFLTRLKDHGTAVYWVGLPAMWKPNYDQSIQTVTAIHQERVLAAGMKYLNIRSTFADENGAFVRQGFDAEGQFRNLRSRDGVHFLRYGNDKLAALILQEIRKDVEAAASGGNTDFDSTVDGSTPNARSTSLNLPIFAQESETGASIPVDLGPKLSAVRPGRGGPNVSGQFQQSVVVSGTAQNVKFAPQVEPGSNAAKVLLTGETVASKPGRADDFSWPPQ